MSSVRSRVAMSDWWASRRVVSVIRTFFVDAACMRRPLPGSRMNIQPLKNSSVKYKKFTNWTLER